MLPPFMFQQPALALQAGAEAPQGAALGDDPVAGDEKGNGIGAAGLPHRPGGVGIPQAPGHFLVGDGFAGGNFLEFLPDPQVIRAALEVQGQVLEGRGFPPEIILQGLDYPAPFLDERGIFRRRSRRSRGGSDLIADELQFFQAGLRERGITGPSGVSRVTWSMTGPRAALILAGIAKSPELPPLTPLHSPGAEGFEVVL